MNTAEEFQYLSGLMRNEEPGWVLVELNDLLTGASRDQIEGLPAPAIDDRPP